MAKTVHSCYKSAFEGQSQRRDCLSKEQRKNLTPVDLITPKEAEASWTDLQDEKRKTVKYSDAREWQIANNEDYAHGR